MVPIKGEWTAFKDHSDKIDHYRAWGLISPKGTKLPPVMVTDGYFGMPEPCQVVGYQTDKWAVIELSDGYHAIHGEYLAELQPKAKYLPRGMTFPEILSDYIVLSIATTEPNSSKAELLEIAAVHYSYGTKLDEYHSLIRPSKGASASIAAPAEIGSEDVSNAPALEEVAPALVAYLGNTPLIGHDIITFAVPFLTAQTGLALDNALVDTCQMAQEAFPLLRSHKLSYLNDAFGLHTGPSHNALDTAYTTNALMWACMSPKKHENNMWKHYIREKREHIEPDNEATIFNIATTDSDTDYIVLDIETTGFDHHSDEIIEIAAVRYSPNGEKLKEYHTLIRPEKKIPAKITALTGIRQEDVEDAPLLAEIIPSLAQFLGFFPICGHNIVSFDIPFLRAQTKLPITNPLIDTLPMSRKAFPKLSSYKLSFLKEALGLGEYKSHRALDDVYTNNALIWACKNSPSYKAATQKQPKSTHAVKRSPSSRPPQFRHIKADSITPTVDEIDESNPLYQKGVAFTGELSIPRETAMQLAVNAGAVIKTSVSKKVSYLIIGSLSQFTLDGMSTKEAKARELNRSGKAHIDIIDEQEFLALVQKKEVTV